MKKLTLKQITEKIKEIDFPKFDLIIAIERNGIMPASLLKHFLNIPVKVI
jgi:hypoxanthine phosphoribosyltransferase